MSKPIVTIKSLKFDGKTDKSWQAELIKETDELLTFVGIFEKEIKHSQLGIIKPGTISYEYYWKAKPFNVFRFHEPEGQLRNYYCNINLPPVLENDVLEYIDLEIDILVWKDLSYEILDLDEFLENASKYSYSDEIHQTVLLGMNQVIELINTKSFPFDYEN